ncbi:hypothetical protein B484DRAFT_448006 [Ochromonadaceae sp. CCMP2298]|nr:hypothetical protein B484DRAFT_448006 [Ochromonadaceae sp. CCMP2298]
MMVSALFYLTLAGLAAQASCFGLLPRWSARSSRASTQLQSTEDAMSEGLDLTGYSMLVTLNGFGDVEDMTCRVQFKDKFAVKFSGGIDSAAPGQWRVIKYEDGRTEVECVHPVLPEYMFFFDIWEPTIIWRGSVDLDTMKVSSGEIVTNKKILGLIPNVVTLATFEADLYAPNDKFPVMVSPKFGDQQFVPPGDFDDPSDMKRFPDLFAPDFQDWWFAVEDAMARGQEPPPRPRPFFVPTQGDATTAEGLAASVSAAREELRSGLGKSKKNKKGGFS